MHAAGSGGEGMTAKTTDTAARPTLAARPALAYADLELWEEQACEEARTLRRNWDQLFPSQMGILRRSRQWHSSEFLKGLFFKNGL